MFKNIVIEKFAKQFMRNAFMILNLQIVNFLHILVLVFIYKKRLLFTVRSGQRTINQRRRY